MVEDYVEKVENKNYYQLTFPEDSEDDEDLIDEYDEESQENSEDLIDDSDVES